MPNKLDIINKKFSRLMPIECIGKNKWKQKIYLCKCDCGRKIIAIGSNLKSRNTKSCGCLLVENINKNRKPNIKHGHAKNGENSKTYIAYRNMIQKCINPNSRAYKNYGARGISICGRWLPENNGFINFLKDMGEIPEDKSLDRIDNNKLINSYSPENCKLSTRKEQMRNTRRNHVVAYNGKEQCISALAEEHNIDAGLLRTRIFEYGWSVEKALITPVRKRNKNAY